MHLFLEEGAGKKWLAFTALLIVMTFGLFWLWEKIGPVQEHLIIGVPYYGITTGSYIENDAQAIAASILGYWGDSRLTTREIAEKLPTAGKLYTLDSLAIFFRAQGYETTIERFGGSRKIAGILRRTNAPLITIRNVKLPDSLSGLRYTKFGLLIGASNTRQLIFHDHLFGNNYEVSFPDFEKEAQATRKSVLIVRPSTSISSDLNKLVATPYTPRLAIMDDLDFRDLALQWIGLEIMEQNPATEMVALRDGWRALTAHPAFEKLHPSARMRIYGGWSRAERELGNQDLAIEIIVKYSLPLNQNLNQSFNEWRRDEDSPAVSFYPWLSLAKAYAAKDDFEKARESMNEALGLAPDDPDVKRENDLLAIQEPSD